MTSETMTPEIKAELRAALEGELSRLQTRVQELGEEGRTLANAEADESGGGGQSADVATDLLEHEIDLTLQRAMSTTVEEIEAAIAKFEAGTYGICENCGTQIKIDRLRAIPWARKCLQCAGRH